MQEIEKTELGLIEIQEFFVRPDNHISSYESLGGELAIRFVGFENFEKAVLKEKLPVLLLCMHRDSDFYEQIEIVKRTTAVTCGDRVKLCLLEEDFVGVFKEKYGVAGTPTFLIFNGGREVSRLLGQVVPEVFQEFLSQAITYNTGAK